MNLYTSYFNMVDYMRPWEIPLSVAVGDPRWFHGFRGQDYIFVDDHGVVNGARAAMLAPEGECARICAGPDCQVPDQNACAFKMLYQAQLSKHEVSRVTQIFFARGLYFRQLLSLDRGPDFILLVHEAPDNPCSVRGLLQQWFREGGANVEEWVRPFPNT